MFFEFEIACRLNPVEINYRNQLAHKHREQGNAYYKESMFVEALKSYNEGLQIAPLKSDIIPLIYANRSAVYMELKQYQLCLENIALAREANYPKDKLKRLYDREVKCIKLMEGKRDDDPWDFFKLSYPAHKNVPFVVNCLEVACDKKFGRKIMTTRDLKPGDIIAIEEPAIRGPSEATHCCQICFKRNNLSLVPNDLMHIMQQDLYCSTRCKNYAKKLFFENLHFDHRNNFCHERLLMEALEMSDGDFGIAAAILHDPSLTSKTVFDFDWNHLKGHRYRRQALVAIANLVSSESSENEGLPSSLAIESRVMLQFQRRLGGIADRNAIGFDHHAFDVKKQQNKLYETRSAGIGILLFGSLLNHSCDNNINRLAVDTKIVFYANRPIAKGQQLFISYGPHYSMNSREDRRKVLEMGYGFKCDCVACLKDFPLMDCSLFIAIHQSVEELARLDDKKTKFKQNCDKLLKIGSNPGSAEARVETLKLIFENMFLISTMTGDINANYYHPEEVRHLFKDE